MHGINNSTRKLKEEFKDINQEERKKVYSNRKSETLKLQEELRNYESLILLPREENNKLKQQVEEKNIDNGFLLSLLEPLSCIATHKILNQSNI